MGHVCARPPMTAPITAVRTLVGGAVLFAMSGCFGGGAKQAPVCPPVTRLVDASTLFRFLPGSRPEPANVDYELTLQEVVSACRQAPAVRGQPETVVVAISPVISALTGPANVQRQASVDVFVSVVDETGTVVAKEQFPVPVPLGPRGDRVTIRDDQTPISVDLPSSGGRSAASYQIWVGLQLTPAELDYNRRRPDIRR